MEEYTDRKGKIHLRPPEIPAKKRDSAYGVFVENEKVLVVTSRHTGLFEFPGGGKRAEETLVKALKREFVEESGMEISSFEKEPFYMSKLKFYADDIREFFDSNMYFFKVTELGKRNLSQIDIKEVQGAGMVPISGISPKNMHEIHLMALKELGLFPVRKAKAL